MWAERFSSDMVPADLPAVGFPPPGLVLPGLVLCLSCVVVMAVCGQFLWRELAFRAGWRGGGTRVFLVVFVSFAFAFAMLFQPATKATPWTSSRVWLDERRQAIQALGDELIRQAVDKEGLLPGNPAALGADSRASWRVPASQTHRYVYRPPLVPIPLAELGDWIILHEPSLEPIVLVGHGDWYQRVPPVGRLRFAFAGSGEVLELSGDELMTRLEGQWDHLTRELEKIDPYFEK